MPLKSVFSLPILLLRFIVKKRLSSVRCAHYCFATSALLRCEQKSEEVEVDQGSASLSRVERVNCLCLLLISRITELLTRTRRSCSQSETMRSTRDRSTAQQNKSMANILSVRAESARKYCHVPAFSRNLSSSGA